MIKKLHTHYAAHNDLRMTPHAQHSFTTNSFQLWEETHHDFFDGSDIRQMLEWTNEKNLDVQCCIYIYTCSEWDHLTPIPVHPLPD